MAATKSTSTNNQILRAPTGIWLGLATRRAGKVQARCTLQQQMRHLPSPDQEMTGATLDTLLAARVLIGSPPTCNRRACSNHLQPHHQLTLKTGLLFFSTPRPKTTLSHSVYAIPAFLVSVPLLLLRSQNSLLPGLAAPMGCRCDGPASWLTY